MSSASLYQPGGSKRHVFRSHPHQPFPRPNTVRPGRIGVDRTFDLLSGVFAGDCSSHHDPRYVYSAEIVEVYDGDTVTVDIDLGFRMWLRDEPLRLWGVDTPEVRGTEKPEGLRVQVLVRSWLPVGEHALIRTLKAKDGGDRTGTFHQYPVMICSDGWSESVNPRLLREGHAELSTNAERERAEIVAYFGFPPD